jgi:hypothetical protein
MADVRVEGSLKDILSYPGQIYSGVEAALSSSRAKVDPGIGGAVRALGNPEPVLAQKRIDQFTAANKPVIDQLNSAMLNNDWKTATEVTRQMQIRAHLEGRVQDAQMWKPVAEMASGVAAGRVKPDELLTVLAQQGILSSEDYVKQYGDLAAKASSARQKEASAAESLQDIETGKARAELYRGQAGQVGKARALHPAMERWYNANAAVAEARTAGNLKGVDEALVDVREATTELTRERTRQLQAYTGKEKARDKMVENRAKLQQDLARTMIEAYREPIIAEIKDLNTRIQNADTDLAELKTSRAEFDRDMSQASPEDLEFAAGAPAPAAPAKRPSTMAGALPTPSAPAASAPPPPQPSGSPMGLPSPAPVAPTAPATAPAAAPAAGAPPGGATGVSPGTAQPSPGPSFGISGSLQGAPAPPLAPASLPGRSSPMPPGLPGPSAAPGQAPVLRTSDLVRQFMAQGLTEEAARAAATQLFLKMQREQGQTQTPR